MPEDEDKIDPGEMTGTGKSDWLGKTRCGRVLLSSSGAAAADFNGAADFNRAAELNSGAGVGLGVGVTMRAPHSPQNLASAKAAAPQVGQLNDGTAV
jgi:hypothetical protein